MECVWNLFTSLFTWLNLHQGLFVAFTTVILLITNGWTLRHYKRQYELDRFLVFMPLKEESLVKIKQYFEGLSLQERAGSFKSRWSYLEKGKTTNHTNEKPLHQYAKIIISDITYAKYLFPDRSPILEEILIAINELDVKIRTFEERFQSNTWKNDEKNERDILIDEYNKIISELKTKMEKFIHASEYQRPPQ